MRYKIIAIVLVLAFLLPFYSAKAIGEFPFGGKIVYSKATICYLDASFTRFLGFTGFTAIPVPVIILVTERAGITKTLAYISYGPLLKFLRISFIQPPYAWYHLYPAGAQALGKYVPIPAIPWTAPGGAGSQCVALFYRNTNIITKIGTSLF